MGPRPGQLALALGSGCLALAGAAWFLRARPAPEAFELLDDPGADEALLDAPRAGTSQVTGRGPFVVEPIDEATARLLFPISADRSVYDPDRYYTYRPELERVHPWPEHPRGAWTERTNAEGLREDGPATLEGADFRVLVVGDSHASGSCDNRDTFSERLQARLAAERPGQRVEVLNAAVPGYSFYNYLGVAKHFLAARPDVLVLAVYGGNDFYGVLRVHHYLRGTRQPPRRASTWERVEEARALSTGFVAQSLNQVLYFQEFPEQADVALEAAAAVTAEIQRLCAGSGTRLLVAYVPPLFEVGHPALEDQIARARARLGIADADLFVARSLRDGYFQDLARLGVPALDLEPVFRGSPEPCYWARDLHISLVGHELVARALDAFLRDPPEPPATPRTGRVPVRRVGPAGTLLVEGEMLDGLRDGEWTERYESGSLRSRGRWALGRREGEWQWWYEGGALKKRGLFRDEEPDGVWVDWYRSGELRGESEWRAGRPWGTWREWHAGGALAAEGEYVDGRQQGPWRRWFPDGTLHAELSYEKGRLQGAAAQWFPGGALEWRGEYDDGRRVGPWELGREDGTPAARGSYRAGRRHGPWTFWRPGGKVDAKQSGEYVDGERVGR